MSGIDYLTNDRGEKKAVVIDLKKHAQLWEDFYDTLVVHARKNEPRESLESVRRRLKVKQAAHTLKEMAFRARKKTSPSR